MTPLFNPLEDSLLAAHPKVMSATYGMEAINVGILSEKFRLLPSLKVKYNWLTGFDAAAYPASIGNYNAGFSFSYPLFLRQSRNTLQFSKFQLEDYSLYRSQASLEVRQMVMSARNELYINFEQLKIQRQIVQQYESLYQYEYILFDNGESSLFRLNIRELKLIEVQIKLIKNQIENEIAKHKYDKSLMVM